MSTESTPAFELEPSTEEDAKSSAFHRYDINPFESRTPWTLRDMLWTIPMTPVVILRFALLSASFLSAGLIIICISPFSLAIRRKGIQPLRLLARLVLYSFGFWWLEEEGMDEEARGHYGIVCAASHTSLIDVFYFTYRWLPAFVAKKDIRKMPFIGWFAEVLGAVFVDRHADSETKEGYKDQIRAIAHNKESSPVLIFPEGTCTNGRALITFKRGAFEPGVNVLPVCIRYKSKLDPSSVGHNSGVPFLFRIMYQWSNQLWARALPVHRPSPEELADPILFANNVQRSMSEALEVPNTRHSIADMWFYQRVVDDELPEDVFQFVFADLYEYFDLRDGQERREFRQILNHLLSRWTQVDEDSDGRIPKEHFLEYAKTLGISPSIAYVIFTQFDRDESGAVDFLELAVSCFSLHRLAKHVPGDGTKEIGDREVRDAYRFYRGSGDVVYGEDLCKLLNVVSGINLPQEGITRYLSHPDPLRGLNYDEFGELYRDYKSYLKLPFAVASVLVSAVLAIPEPAELQQ